MLTPDNLYSMAKTAAQEITPEAPQAEPKKPLRQAIDTAKDVGAGVVGAAAGAINQLHEMDKPSPLNKLP